MSGGGLLGGLIKHPTLYSPLLPRGTLRVPPPLGESGKGGLVGMVGSCNVCEGLLGV